MPYVIKLESRGYGEEYFTGSRFIVQGDMYATLGNLCEAKRFKSAKIAQRSANSLNKYSSQDGSFTVLEIEERDYPGVTSARPL